MTSGVQIEDQRDLRKQGIRECNLVGAQYNNTLENLNISIMNRAKIAYRYCKSQTFIMQGHFHTYSAKTEEETAALGTKLHTTLWLNLALMRDKWS